MSAAFYNEIDPFAAQTIREAIAAGAIAPGIVDERDIRDIRPDELAGYSQVHLFAGGGVWSYALRQAGWPDDEPIWTCSCPCQPFSAAGKGEGFADERHLWPAAEWLIRQCEPVVIAGEQVADKGAEPWIDLVQADLEALDYAFGCVPLASAGFGAPNIRHRAFWLAHASHSERRPQISRGDDSGGANTRWPQGQRGLGACRENGRLGDALCDGAEPVGGNCNCAQGEAFGKHGSVSRPGIAARNASIAGGLADAARIGHEWGGTTRRRGHGPSHGGDPIRLADTMRAGRPERRAIAGDGQTAGRSGASDRDPGPVNGFWRNADWLLCRDPGGARWRPVDAGTFPLAPGHSGRVGGLRVSGNAINAQVATAFIEAVIGHFGGFVADLQPLDQSSDQCADPAGLTAPVDIPDVSFIHNGANK